MKMRTPNVSYRGVLLTISSALGMPVELFLDGDRARGTQ